jgi:hypothetical protein
MKNVFRASIGVSLLVALLAYLRDPPWVLSYVYGLQDWQLDSDLRPVRWTAGRAAFHVPADLRGVVLPLRFEKQPSDWPRTAVITVDDRPAEQVTFADSAWRNVTVHLPPRGARRARRIDIKLDRVSPGNRGLQLAEVQFLR